MNVHWLFLKYYDSFVTPLLTTPLLLTVNVQSPHVQSGVVLYFKGKWLHIVMCTNHAQTVEIVKDWGEPHQSCCPSNGQLGLTQSEVNYSHISVKVCVCQYETGGVAAPGCPYVPNTHLIHHSSLPRQRGSDTEINKEVLSDVFKNPALHLCSRN